MTCQGPHHFTPGWVITQPPLLKLSSLHAMKLWWWGPMVNQNYHFCYTFVTVNGIWWSCFRTMATLYCVVKLSKEFLFAIIPHSSVYFYVSKDVTLDLDVLMCCTLIELRFLQCNYPLYFIWYFYDYYNAHVCRNMSKTLLIHNFYIRRHHMNNTAWT